MDYSTRNEITEAAVVQSLTENEIIRSYIDRLDTPLSEKPITIQALLDGVSNDWVSNGVNTPVPEDMSIIRSYVATHPDFGNAEILSSHAFDNGGHCMVLSNGDDKYVAFDGTDGNAEWKDNGEGLYREYSDHQWEAKKYFDSLVNDSVISGDDNVIVTGHSKGGNKAMFVTMEDRDGIVDKCIALDGQGFSPEALKRWNHMYFGTTGYSDRTSKITLVAGSNDYVHALGIKIAGTTYTIGYSPWVTTGDNPNSIKDELASWHSHEHLFTPVWDEKLGMYNFVLNPEAQPSPIEGILNSFMDSFMMLPPELRQMGADPVMNFFRKGTSNTLKDYLGLISVLMTIGFDKSGLDELINITGAFNPNLVKVVRAAIKTAIANKSVSSTSTKVGSGSKSGSKSISTGVSNGAKNANAVSGSSQTIELNKESLIDLRDRLNSVFDEVQIASDRAYEAETVAYDAVGCGAVRAVPRIEAQMIRDIINMIIDSISSVDSQMKKEVEDIIGPDIYTAVKNGYTVIYNEDGTYKIRTQYSATVEEYIRANKDYLLTINGGNVGNIGISYGIPWCDKFADYVITASGQKSPGNTTGAMTEAMENAGLRHGYSGSEETWNKFNSIYGANVHNDGYVPQTGDLVFFDWDARWDDPGNVGTDHVGIIYVDPDDGITKVLHGNYSNRVQLTNLDQLVGDCDHISIGDMTTYNMQ